MGARIRQSDLRNDNASVMRRVAAGESFVVTVNGRPVADVVPHDPTVGKRRFVPVGEAARALGGLDGPDPGSWQQDLDESDAHLAADEPVDPFDRTRR